MCRTNCLRPNSGLVLNLRVLIVNSDMAPAGARELGTARVNLLGPGWLEPRWL